MKLKKNVLRLLFIALIIGGCNKEEEIGITPVEEEFGVERISKVPDGVEPLSFNNVEELRAFLSSRRDIIEQHKGEILDLSHNIKDESTSVKSGEFFSFVADVHPEYYWFSTILIEFSGQRGGTISVRSELTGLTVGVNWKMIGATTNWLTSETFEFKITAVEYYHVPPGRDLYSSAILIHGKAFINTGNVQTHIE